jgi:hypothetical protein
MRLHSERFARLQYKCVNGVEGEIGATGEYFVEWQQATRNAN